MRFVIIFGFHILQVINLHEQLRNYKKVESKFRYKFGDVKARKRLTKAVYMFSIGGNDYSSSSTFLTNYPKSEYVDMVIGNITFVITVSFSSLILLIYGKKRRKYI